MADASLSPIARALGRIPTGLYVVTTVLDGKRAGFVGSFLVQTGFSPPTVCVAVSREREHLRGIHRSEHFAVSILDEASKGLMQPFFKKGLPDPFEGLDLGEVAGGAPVLTGSLAWLACKVIGEHELPDHVVVFGEVVDARLGREGEPLVHLRRNGLSY
jgi:flavin reductase (DIM6/NTAB) family NADH-FMN oxidoreductase RutF